jgi:hypothetical protein
MAGKLRAASARDDMTVTAPDIVERDSGNRHDLRDSDNFV